MAPTTCIGCGTKCSTDCYPTHASDYACHNAKCRFHKSVEPRVAGSVAQDEPPVTRIATPRPHNSPSTGSTTRNGRPSPPPPPPIHKVRFANDNDPRVLISEIEPGLFIGNKHTVDNAACMEQHNIKAVISVISAHNKAFPPKVNVNTLHPLEKLDLKDRLCVIAEDDDASNLIQHFAGACKFIESHLYPHTDQEPRLFMPTELDTDTDARESETERVVLPDARSETVLGDAASRDILPRQGPGSVLVHCTRGVSRSPTIVIAYLMWKHRWSVEKAIKSVQEKRRFIRPTNSFIDQLMVWQEVGYDIYSNDKFLIPTPAYEALLDRLRRSEQTLSLKKKLFRD